MQVCKPGYDWLSLHVFLHPPVQRVRDVDFQFRCKREKMRFADPS